MLTLTLIIIPITLMLTLTLIIIPITLILTLTPALTLNLTPALAYTPKPNPKPWKLIWFTT